MKIVNYALKFLKVELFSGLAGLAKIEICAKIVPNLQTKLAISSSQDFHFEMQ